MDQVRGRPRKRRGHPENRKPLRGEVAFGPDGLPKAGPSGEHGIGLKNVKAVVDQYGGILSCGQKDGYSP